MFKYVFILIVRRSKECFGIKKMEKATYCHENFNSLVTCNNIKPSIIKLKRLEKEPILLKDDIIDKINIQ